MWNSQRFKTGSTANYDGEGSPHIPLRTGTTPQLPNGGQRPPPPPLDNNKVSARFVNDVGVGVALHWVQHDGERKFIMNLAAGEATGMSTYPGHRCTLSPTQPPYSACEWSESLVPDNVLVACRGCTGAG